MTDSLQPDHLSQLAQKHLESIMDEFDYGREAVTVEAVLRKDPPDWLIRFQVAEHGSFEIIVSAQADQSDDPFGYRIAEAARTALLRNEALSMRYGYEM